MVLDFLQTYNEVTFGPIQQDEALFLYGLCRMVRPVKVLEYGSLLGQSARVWVEYGAQEIHCVDMILSRQLKEMAHQVNRHQPGRMVLHEANMVDFQPPHLDFDLVFIDASHQAEDNLAVVRQIGEGLKPGTLIGFHDTGHWHPDHLKGDKEKRWFFKEFGGQDAGTHIIHHPGEKETIKQVSEGWPYWQRMDFWTMNVPRYGITLFKVQKGLFNIT